MAKPRIKRGADGAHARELDRHVGARMRARRIMLGLTQQQLAERIGIAYQQAHKYEKGINRMAVSRLYKVAQALGVDVGYFFEGLQRAEESPSGVTPQQRLVLELAKNFMTLSPEHQQAICTIVRMLSEPAAIRRLGPLSLDVQSPGRPNTAEPAATTASPAAEASPEPIGGSAHTASMP